MMPLTLTVARIDWRFSTSRMRKTPRRCPYSAQPTAFRSGTPALSGLPIGPIPGHLSSDHHSNDTRKKTAILLPPGQRKSSGKLVSTPPAWMSIALNATLHFSLRLDAGLLDDLGPLGNLAFEKDA